jgi:hypothetical protein
MTVHRQWLLGLVVELVAVAVATCAAPGVAGADDAPPSIDAPAEHRSGVVIGTAIGLGLAGSSGYPNNASLIGSPDYYSQSNLMIGANTSVFVMGAVADYVNFGFFFGGGTAKSHDWRSTSTGVGFRFEVFPLYRLYPTLRDLGFATKLGVGTTHLATRLPGDYPTSSGSQSLVSIGAFYEFTLTKLGRGHIAGGPSFDYDVINAAAIERHTAIFGFRFAFYGSK